jgi:hypothetical protein
MIPVELKQWQSDLGLSEAAMAHYLGVPVHTLRGWIKGTRALQAAPLRLIEVLKQVQFYDKVCTLHADLITDARASEPAKRQAGRPSGSRNRAKSSQIDAGAAIQAPVSPTPQTVPSWLSGAL